MRMLSFDECVKIYDNKLYTELSDLQIAWLQLNQERLFIPFNIFHHALEKSLGYSVFTHQIAWNDFIKELETRYNYSDYNCDNFLNKHMSN